MPNQNNCPKCGSSERIPDVAVMMRGTRLDVVAEVKSRPHALLFEGTIRSALTAIVCPACGFTELYATDARDLQWAHRTRQSSGEAG